MIGARLAVGILTLVSGSAGAAAQPTSADYIDNARRMFDPYRAEPHRAPHGDAALIPTPGISGYAPREHVRGFGLGSATAELATYNIRRGARAGDTPGINETRAHARGATFSVRQDNGSAISLMGEINVQQLRERAAGSSAAARPNDIRDVSAGLRLIPPGWPTLSIQAEHLTVAARPSDFDRIALLGTTPTIPGNGFRLGLSGGGTGRGALNWDISLRTLKPAKASVDGLASAYSGRMTAATLGLRMSF
ncbi:MAG: hypothetical protein JSS55_01465 [Proteobacteria bacterium]|nr:hypothetical protein [Pseudomonadota bacterium]